jgi:hypothetical protein
MAVGELETLRSHQQTKGPQEKSMQRTPTATRGKPAHRSATVSVDVHLEKSGHSTRRRRKRGTTRHRGGSGRTGGKNRASEDEEALDHAEALKEIDVYIMHHALEVHVRGKASKGEAEVPLVDTTHIDYPADTILPIWGPQACIY